jgi:hypothetical protein
MVASRRQVLRSAGALLAAAAGGPAVAQTFTATAISQAAQQARREVGRLGRRADNLLRQTVADGPDKGGAAVRRFRGEQVHLARDLVAIFNGRVSEDDWLLIVPTSELDLALTMQPLVVRLAPRPEEIEAAVKAPLPKIEPLAADEIEDVVLMIVVAALGLPPGDAAMFAHLKDDNALAAALRDTAAALKARRYGLSALEFERLMRLVVLPRNVEVLVGAGRTRQRNLYRALAVWFVPFIGWSFFIARLLAITYQARDGAAPMLR